MKNAKKKAALGVLALLTAASVAAGSLFESPAALLPDDGAPSIVCNVNADGADDDAGAPEDESDETRRRGGVRAALRQRILQLPLIVRLLVILPLWWLGTVLLAAAGAVWPLLSPVLSRIASFLVPLVLLTGLFLLAAKTVFPDLPLRKVFSRRGAVALLLGASALAAADAALPIVWEGYAAVKQLVEAGVLFLALCCATVPLALSEQRRRRESGRAEKAEGKKPEKLLVTDGVETYELRVPRT